jgi:hypothetical protein
VKRDKFASLKIMINWSLFDEINQNSCERGKVIKLAILDRFMGDGITKIKLKSVNSTQKCTENIKIVHSPLSLICAMGQEGRPHQLCPMALDKQPPKTASIPFIYFRLNQHRPTPRFVLHHQ